MSNGKLTGKQTLLLGQAISSLDLAKNAMEEAEKKLQALESSLVGVDNEFSEAVTEAVGEVEEAICCIDNASLVNDFAYEDGSERRVSKMLRGMEHRG
jgi:hypothetical protein